MLTQEGVSRLENRSKEQVLYRHISRSRSLVQRKRSEMHKYVRDPVVLTASGWIRRQEFSQ